MRFLLVVCAFSATALCACGGGRRAAGGGPGGPVATQLTPDPQPICGDFNRPYIAPESTGQTNPAQPAPGFGTLDAVQSRIAREGEGFNLYAQADQDLIRNGRARVGLDERAAYLAHGLPAFYWNVEVDEQPCRVMLFGVLGNPEVDTTVYTCNGLVTYITVTEPRLPCWRLAEVAPRAVERAAHFDAAGVERQWEILHGLLARGQNMNDVYIGFGEAFRAGLEAREDGTNADQHVYLDTTGDAYALYLTFVDRELRGWRFPPDRRLTPAAEQRRLDAMEQRMMDQLREIEQRSIARHQEEMSRLNTIQETQGEIRADIANARSSIIDAVAQQGEMTRGTVVSDGAITRGAVRDQQARDAQTNQTPPPSGGRVRQPSGTQPDNPSGTPPPSGTQPTAPPPAASDTGPVQARRIGNTIYVGRSGLGRECSTTSDCPERYMCSPRRNICMPDSSWITVELGRRGQRYRNAASPNRGWGAPCGIVSTDGPIMCPPQHECLVQSRRGDGPIVGNCVHQSVRAILSSDPPVGRGSFWFMASAGH